MAGRGSRVGLVVARRGGLFSSSSFGFGFSSSSSSSSSFSVSSSLKRGYFFRSLQTQILDGRKVADEILEEVREEAELLKKETGLEFSFCFS